MIAVEKKPIPEDILNNSVLVHLAGAYFSVGKKLERKSRCSQTRGFIMSTLRGGAALNQNRIARLLGFDRTVVHRAIKAMVREGLASEKKAKTGKAILVQLSPRGNKYRERLIKQRRSADEKLRKEMTADDRATLLRLLRVIAQLEF